MPPLEFIFDLELPGRAASSDLVEDLTAHVLALVGRTQDAPGIAREIEGALGSGTANNGDYSLSFVSRGGQLEVAVSYKRGRVWHTTRPLS